MSLLINETRYSRILSSDGSNCSSTNGKLDVNVYTPVHHGYLFNSKDEVPFKIADLHSFSKVSIYGRTVTQYDRFLEQSGELNILVSNDLKTWFTAESHVIQGDFHIFFRTGCRYIKIQTNMRSHEKDEAPLEVLYSAKA